MIVLPYFPKNKDRFLRLIEFCKEVLDICSDLGISPILNGSLAVFAYTKNEEMSIDDVDLACSETEFPKIISALEERNINYKVKRWHVLQILHDDLKVELDSIEYWYKDLSMVGETLQIDSYTINMLSLKSLKEFYRRGIRDTADKTEENERNKCEALKRKYEVLEQVKG
jgi:Aminoglycoside-2''-adenylyltransferase